jgi:hypothetical protein
MKKATLLLLTVVCIMNMGGRAMAQDAGAMKKWTDFMTPGDMHKLLAAATGKWTEEITMWMAPGQPPVKSTSVSEYKMILGGRYQQASISGSFNGTPFEAMSLIGYDNMKKMFFSSWIDNMGTGILNSEGPYDAATGTITLIGTEVDPMSGKELRMRETIQMPDNNTMIMVLYIKSGEKEVKNSEIKMKRM